MIIDIDNSSQMLSHLMLQDDDISMLVADTQVWKNDGKIIAKATFNGIEVDGSVLEKTLKSWLEQVEAHYREQYAADAFDQRVEEKARELIKEHGDNALEKLYALTQILEDPDQVIRPHWERDREGLK